MDEAIGNKEVLNQMGNFDGESIVLKKMARQGQFFSGTKEITTLTADEIEEIDDICLLD